MSFLSVEERLRRLQYRLKRQGMLELDVWLSTLNDALVSEDKEILQRIEYLLELEVPELLAMQAGQKRIPKELEPWLN